MSSTIVQTEQPDFRQQRGRELAETRRIRRTPNGWIVPSQRDANDKYIVLGETCTCPDHTTRGVLCKHYFAVQVLIRRETAADGSVTETESLTIKRVTYRQDWHAYNAAQTE